MGENYHGLVGSVSNSGGGDLIFSFWGHLHCHTSDKEKRILLSEEVQSLILKGAIEVSGSFSISRILLPSFLSSQENWGYEASYRSFYPAYVSLGTSFQNGNQSFHQILDPLWYVDKKPRSHGCVLSHPYCSSLQKCLRFAWDNIVYHFRTLPFGISTAPIVFTRVFPIVIAHLHTLSIQIHSYLDDSLIRDFNQQTLVSQARIVIQLFLNLFFLISWKKELTPSQNFLFLGEHYRTDLGLIFPAEEQLVSICQRIMLF